MIEGYPKEHIRIQRLRIQNQLIRFTLRTLAKLVLKEWATTFISASFSIGGLVWSKLNWKSKNCNNTRDNNLNKDYFFSLKNDNTIYRVEGERGHPQYPSEMKGYLWLLETEHILTSEVQRNWAYKWKNKDAFDLKAT